MSYTKKEIREKINGILVDKFYVEQKDIKDDALMASNLGADSIDIVELTMELEKEFGVTIPDSDAEKIQTVGDAIAYIENAGK